MPTYAEQIAAIKASRAEQERAVAELLRANPKLPRICAELTAISGPPAVREAMATLRSGKPSR